MATHPDTDLEAKAREIVGRARAALQNGGIGADESDPPGRELAGTWQALADRLASAPPTAPARAAGLCELFVQVTALQQDLREREVGTRLDVLARIHAGLARLGGLSKPAELIDAAPAELARCCDFDRTLISRVRGSTWVPEQVYIADGQDPTLDASIRDYVKRVEIPLSSTLMETELVRRGTPALVDNPLNHQRTFKDLMTITQTQGYVAAPIMPTSRVIGFLHADTHGSGRTLTLRDRDNIWTFAEGFGLIFERAVLLQRLGAQRARAHEAFASAEAMIDELSDSQVLLARTEHEPSPSVVSRPMSGSRAASGESRLHALLTPREREVLALMASGATNGQIADQLVISHGTVKSHVKHVLRKLRASTRAEAVSRSLHLSMREHP